MRGRLGQHRRVMGTGQAFNRRSFCLAGGSLAGLQLAGCTNPTTLASASAPKPCLPPARVAPDRIIRTVAGLRPYRRSGFVVRREQLGEKALVHNYGHGGAGITMSWGTSRLAVDLGLPGHRGRVAVIGSGVMGLTTARLVQEAGFPVTIYTKALPPETTSNIAGGQWSPVSLFEDDAVDDAWLDQFQRALDYSWRRFQIMVGAEYSIRWMPTYIQTSGNYGGEMLRRFHPDAAVLEEGQHPFPVGRIYRFDTMYIETGHFLRQLLRDVRIAGGDIAVRSFETPAQIAELPETLVFNCTGLGSHHLFGDSELEPVRGQLAILLPQPGLDYAFGGASGYMFPRPDGVVLGGTFEHGEWDARPQPDAIARIVARHQQFFGAMRCEG